MKELIIAETAGYCFGVSRAVKMLFELAKKGPRPIVTLGPVIHNPQFMEKIRGMGITTVDRPEDIPEGSLAVVRTHGVPLSVRFLLDKKGIECADLTCPFVKKIHDIVAKASADGLDVIIAGDPGHPEVAGIRGHCVDAGRCEVVKDSAELTALAQNAEFFLKKYIIVAQTTYNIMEWGKICDVIRKKHYTNIAVFDTICYAAEERQNEAARISATVELMLVVGGKNSSNTTKLYDICRQRCEKTHHIESVADLPLAEIRMSQRIGLTAGASTPDDIIKEVVSVMTEIDHSAVTAHEEMNFEEALEQSLKTVRRGDIVKCTIVSVQPNEIQVDLGIKHTGIIPSSEISEEDFATSDLYKPGREIEVQVLNVNDQDGTVTLSKKKLDAQKEWVTIEDSKENGTVLTATVASAVNGGVIVNFKGIRVFIPASQASLTRNVDLESLVGTKVDFKVIEIERRRRRVIGSIRAVLSERKKALAEKTWEELEVGKHIRGVVKSLTSFGAFVDIGGVDGMVHISELSWSRIRHPSEAVSVGDTVDVYVKDFDREANRISLGYKKPEDNPWLLFKARFNTGDIAEVKILKLMKYGAFAQIIDGVDGLIHISRIADRHIAKVSDVLRTGDIVRAKIVDIDEENQKVSLSIRALLEEGMPLEQVFLSGSHAGEPASAPEKDEPAEAPESGEKDTASFDSSSASTGTDDPAEAPESGEIDDTASAPEKDEPAEAPESGEKDTASFDSSSASTGTDDPAEAPESGEIDDTAAVTEKDEPAEAPESGEKSGKADTPEKDDPAEAPESGEKDPGSLDESSASTGTDDPAEAPESGEQDDTALVQSGDGKTSG